MKRSLGVLLALLFVASLPAGCGGSKKNPTAPVDSTPPGLVADLIVTAADSTSITLGWTAPGDNGAAGTAAAYEVRFGNTDVVSPTDWSNWSIASAPAPRAAGTPERLRITGLAVGTPYAFALRTRDAGGNWSGPSNTVLSHTAGYREGPVLVVGRSGSPYAKYSHTGGRTWRDATAQGQSLGFGQLTRAGTGPNALLAVAPEYGQSLLGVGASRVWISEDYGSSWQVISDAVWHPSSDLHGGGIRSLVTTSTEPITFFASLNGICDASGNNCCGNCAGQIYRSGDVGSSWIPLGGNLPLQPLPPYQNVPLPFPALAINPGNAQQIYAGGRRFCYSFGGGIACFPSLWRSTDGGSTWTGNSTGIGDADIHTLAVHPAEPTHVFASSSMGLRRSLNSGATWTQVSPVTDVLPFTFHPTDPLRIYTPKLRSTDGGATWLPMSPPAGVKGELGLDAGRDELYVVGSGGVYRSGDQGQTWTLILPDGNCTTLVVLPDIPGGPRRQDLRASRARTPARAVRGRVLGEDR